jgi:hypothetical protein
MEMFISYTLLGGSALLISIILYTVAMISHYAITSIINIKPDPVKKGR